MRTDMGIDCLESVIGVNYSCSLNNVENKFNKLRGLQDEGRCVFYTTKIKKNEFHEYYSISFSCMNNNYFFYWLNGLTQTHL